MAHLDRNPRTGVLIIDEVINGNAKYQAKRLGIKWKYDHDGRYSDFDREGYIEEHIRTKAPFPIVWIQNTKRLCCRYYQDVFGIPDIVGIQEIPTLFSNVKGMESYRIFLIPYICTGYDIPPELEDEPELLVPFTAKMIEKMKEIDASYS